MSKAVAYKLHDKAVIKSPFHFKGDMFLVIITLIILMIGMVVLFTSSVDVVNKNTGNPFYLLNKQMIFCLIAILMGVCVYAIPMKVWSKASPYSLAICLIALVLLLIPPFGVTVNGATRWLNLVVFALQVSELMKLAFILYLGGYLVRRAEEVNDKFSGLMKPLVIFSVIALLLLMQPDFGATVVLFSIAMFMLFIGGVKFWQFSLFTLFMVAAFVMLIVSSTYRMQRVAVFMDPWSDPFNSGYQLTQSLIAFGSGGVIGNGLGEGVQKLFYLPEAYNDFMLAILAEELGAVGVIVVLLLFILLIGRMFILARQASNQAHYFNAYVVYGIACWFLVQVFISYGVNMGMLPTKGLTLPLMSAGGSSLVTMLVAVAMVLRVSKESRDALMPLRKAKQ